MKGEIFDLPKMREKLLEKTELIKKAAKMMDLKEPDLTSEDCYFSP